MSFFKSVVSKQRVCAHRLFYISWIFAWTAWKLERQRHQQLNRTVRNQHRSSELKGCFFLLFLFRGASYKIHFNNHHFLHDFIVLLHFSFIAFWTVCWLNSGLSACKIKIWIVQFIQDHRSELNELFHISHTSASVFDSYHISPKIKWKRKQKKINLI